MLDTRIIFCNTGKKARKLNYRWQR